MMRKDLLLAMLGSAAFVVLLASCAAGTKGASAPEADERAVPADAPALPLDEGGPVVAPATPPGLDAKDAFVKVLTCGDHLEVFELEGKPVVVHWPILEPLGPTQFRLARWDEASGKFEEREGPTLNVRGKVAGVILRGTWDDPQLFVVDGMAGTSIVDGRRHLETVNGTLAYQVATSRGGKWSVAKGQYASPPSQARPDLDSEIAVDKRLEEARSKIAIAPDGCEDHDTTPPFFAHGWKVGHVVGRACAKPFAYAVHQRRSGDVETYSWPTNNFSPQAPRVRVAAIGGRWHVFLQRLKTESGPFILEKLFVYDNEKLAPVELPEDELFAATWLRGDSICAGGAKRMWCRSASAWSAVGQGSCVLNADLPTFQSGSCLRGPNKRASIVGDGKGAFHELPESLGSSCRRLDGRDGVNVLCGSNLVFLTGPTTELAFALPNTRFEVPAVWVSNVPWVARNEDPNDLMRSRELATKALYRLGKPVKTFSCTEDGGRLLQQ